MWVGTLSRVALSHVSRDEIIHASCIFPHNGEIGAAGCHADFAATHVTTILRFSFWMLNRPEQSHDELSDNKAFICLFYEQEVTVL